MLQDMLISSVFFRVCAASCQVRVWCCCESSSFKSHLHIASYVDKSEVENPQIVENQLIKVNANLYNKGDGDRRAAFNTVNCGAVGPLRSVVLQHLACCLYI